MISFFFAFLQRVLSGLASLFGYSNKFIGLYGVSAVMIALPFFTTPHWNWFFYLYVVINIIVIAMKAISFDDNIKVLQKYKDIHLWENLVTGGFMVFLACTDHNLLMLFFSVYPALILHKGLINIGCKLPFFDEQTDDPTGKTYAIPLLGIKVPRIGTKLRLIFAGLSVVGVIVVYMLKLNISVYLF